MDNFTASVLLSAAMNGEANNDELADLYKMVKGDDCPPTHDQVDWFVNNEGKIVSVNNTNHVGVVHKLNKSRSGLYPGGRFPIYVKMTGGNNIGEVFEYAIEQLTIVENKPW